MRRCLCLIAIFAVCFVCALGALLRCADAQSFTQRKVDAKVMAVHTFNDLSSFAADLENPRRFRFVDNKKANEAYLRFRIVGFDPSRYRLTMRIRAKPAALKSFVVRTATGVIKDACSLIEGDVATYTVDMSSKKQFMWSDGACYIGLRAPKFMLKQDDVVELLDFKFQLR